MYMYIYIYIYIDMFIYIDNIPEMNTDVMLLLYTNHIHIDMLSPLIVNVQYMYVYIYIYIYTHTYMCIYMS